MEKKKITVWKDGQKIKSSLNNSSNKYTKNNGKNRKYKQTIKTFTNSRNSQSRVLKSQIVAISFACIIGISLGIIVLNMITNIDDYVHDDSMETSLQNGRENEQTTEGTNEQQSVTLNEIDAYVLQGGVFSSKENAESSATLFEDSKLEPIIWEKDDHYHILLGVTKTKDQAKALMNDLDENEFDLFIKSWTTDDIELHLTEDEHMWLKSFINLWDETLTAVSQQETIQADEWEQLITDIPNDVSVLDDFIVYVQEVIEEDINNVDHLTAQHMLLKMWKAYETLHS